MRGTAPIALIGACLALAPAGAQAPRIGDINFYGLRKLSQSDVLGAIKIEPGGPLPGSKADLEEKLEDLRDVVDARVTAVCCQGDRTAIFVGVAERGEPIATFRSEPSGDASLPQDILDRYQLFLSAVDRASAHGNTAEDFTAGHSMMDDPAARAIQPDFVTFATAHFDVLKKALHECSDPETRAAAAAITGYGAKKQTTVDELQFALNDPDPAVRGNAMHALSALVVYSRKHPEAGLKIEPVWLVELLRSIELRDREESSKALVLLTDGNGGQSAVDLMRERALPALAEMARWPTLRYALPPFLLMGRIAGLSDKDTEQAWERGAREPVILKALDSGKKNRK